MTTEDYIKWHGEQHRKLIVDSLAWLEESEPVWGLDTSIDRDEFIRELINKAEGTLIKE